MFLNLRNLVLPTLTLLLFSVGANTAGAQSTEAATEAEAGITQSASGPTATPELAKDFQDEISNILDDATGRFKSMDSNAMIGMGTGMIGGAVIADLLGGGGIVTLTGMIAGGVAGLWAGEKLF